VFFACLCNYSLLQLFTCLSFLRCKCVTLLTIDTSLGFYDLSFYANEASGWWLTGWHFCTTQGWDGAEVWCGSIEGRQRCCASRHAEESCQFPSVFVERPNVPASAPETVLGTSPCFYAEGFTNQNLNGAYTKSDILVGIRQTYWNGAQDFFVYYQAASRQWAISPRWCDTPKDTPKDTPPTIKDPVFFSKISCAERPWPPCGLSEGQRPRFRFDHAPGHLCPLHLCTSWNT
jgi:hypothetical protein